MEMASDRRSIRAGIEPETAVTDVQTRDEQLERQHLAETVRLLTAALERLTTTIDSSASAIQAHKEHMWTHWRDMDGVEKANVRVEVNTSVTLAEHAVTVRNASSGC
ncbi:hypothetical protein [Micromonospora parastrephiae]|uniref:hypothetical protein n=1 Tax=Micromonospora parastrephiae TaxID=2806101 RepID=UPI001EE47AAF|nr:hypothetical protein [Micromonospora parastrephiae]